MQEDMSSIQAKLLALGQNEKIKLEMYMILETML